MAWHIIWQVVCESCGQKGPMRHNTKLAESQAVKRGWVRTWGPVGAAHVCSECAKAGRFPDYWPKAKESPRG